MSDFSQDSVPTMTSGLTLSIIWCSGSFLAVTLCQLTFTMTRPGLRCQVVGVDVRLGVEASCGGPGDPAADDRADVLLVEYRSLLSSWLGPRDRKRDELMFLSPHRQQIQTDEVFPSCLYSGMLMSMQAACDHMSHPSHWRALWDQPIFMSHNPQGKSVSSCPVLGPGFN